MNARILLVEDDALLRHAFKLLLEDSGYAIEEAGTAAEAVAKGKEFMPQLILLDMGLPDAPGTDVARNLRTHPGLETIPIVALTGRVGMDEKNACLEAGCTHFLSKPVEVKVLLKKVSEFLQ